MASQTKTCDFLPWFCWMLQVSEGIDFSDKYARVVVSNGVSCYQLNL